MGHRIAITGGSSTGKTTLLLALQQDSSLSRCLSHFLEEGARSLLHDMNRSSFDSLSREEARSFQREFFQWKASREQDIDCYVVDRSFVDLAAVWRERDTYDQPTAVQDELIVPCRRLSQRYTLHVHLVDMTGDFEFDGVREADVLLHMRIANRIASYLSEWGLRTVRLTGRTTIERVEELRGFLCVGPQG